MLAKRQKKMMQYQLLELALREEGLIDCNININHENGFSIVNDVEIYLKYPKSYLNKISKLDQSKTINYAFKGGLKFSKSNIDRSEILKDFMADPNNQIIETYYGIKRKQKTDFDESYYQLLCNSKFSLCPNWSGPQWDHEYAWTYRFIESCFTKSIPIIFRSQPLGKTFTKDIFFYWNDEKHIYDESIVETNYKKAIEYFTLTNQELRNLKNV
jgi:hypothetical protein